MSEGATEDLEPEKPRSPIKEPPKGDPSICPKCGTAGKYCGRQQQSEKFTLIAWSGCECGHTWGYTYSNDKLPEV